MTKLDKISFEMDAISAVANAKIIELRDKYNLTEEELQVIRTKHNLMAFALNIDKLSNNES